jgi:hypothetical protein
MPQEKCQKKAAAVIDAVLAAAAAAAASGDYMLWEGLSNKPRCGAIHHYHGDMPPKVARPDTYTALSLCFLLAFFVLNSNKASCFGGVHIILRVGSLTNVMDYICPSQCWLYRRVGYTLLVVGQQLRH